MLRYFYILIFLFAVLFSSCKSDDDYMPLTAETRDDAVSVLQNEMIEIDVLGNDLNIPQTGSLSVAASANATILVTDPENTPSNPSDDLISYTPAANFTGQDTFSYTICDSNGSYCSSANVRVTVQSASPVRYVPEELPYDKLSDYNFFNGELAALIPVFGVLPYEPISSLFSDYAHKARFIWMPNNASAQYAGDHQVLDFPEGTILIKNFYYTNVLPANSTQLIETRLMIRKDQQWLFANYIWNEAQDEAFFNLQGGPVEVTWLQDGVKRTVNYRIPTESQCFTCHKDYTDSTPIGLKPQNLNGSYNYPEGPRNQLNKFAEMGYLDSSYPSDINTVVDWQDSSASLNLRVRSYFDINCAHCHSDVKHCDYRPMRFAFEESADPVNLGVCVDPDTNIPPFTKIVNPGDKETSVLHFRFSTTEEQYRMPLFGRTLVHDEALALVEEWIDSLTETCE